MIRRKGGQVVQDWELPLFSSKEGRVLLEEIIKDAWTGSKAGP
jgi:hypothetical protein